MLQRSAAKALQSTTTRIDVGSATAPTVGQVLTATGGSAATWQTPSGGSVEATTKTITQAAHGFAVGDVLKYSSSVYAKAQADSAANAEVVGIVSAVADANNFTLTSVGYVSGLSGLTANTTYFLSPTTAGALTATEPNTAGQVSKPLFRAVSTSAGYFFNWRGTVIGSGREWDVNLVLTSDFTVTNASLTDVPGFSFATLANECWYIEVRGFTSANHPTGDAYGTILTTGTWYQARSVYSGFAWNGSGTLQQLTWGPFNSSTNALGGSVINSPMNDGDGLVRPFSWFLYCVVATNGDIKMQFGNQSPAAGRTSTLKAGTIMRAKKLSV